MYVCVCALERGPGCNCIKVEVLMLFPTRSLPTVSVCVASTPRPQAEEGVRWACPRRSNENTAPFISDRLFCLFTSVMLIQKKT